MIFFDNFFSKKNWSEEFVAFADCCVFFTQKLWQMAGAAFICCISHGRDDDTNGTSIRIDGLMQLSAIVTVVPDVSSLSKAQVLKMAVAMEGIAALCFIERTPLFFFVAMHLPGVKRNPKIQSKSYEIYQIQNQIPVFHYHSMFNQKLSVPFSSLHCFFRFLASTL